MLQIHIPEICSTAADEPTTKKINKKGWKILLLKLLPTYGPIIISSVTRGQVVAIFLILRILVPWRIRIFSQEDLGSIGC